jgi:type I restriction enzyme, S subunit
MATSQHFANWVCGPKLLQIYLMYAFVTVRDSPTMSGEGSTVTTIYMPALKTLKIATPPISEQTEIVCRVETLFAFADRLEARLAQAQAQAQAQTAASRLTPELLAKAFRGELVPQDSNDEPAAELLRRLAETSAIPAKQGRVAKVI